MSDEFRETLSEVEQTSYDDLISNGYTVSSIKKYLDMYDDDFNEAWDALKKDPDKELTVREQKVHDKMVEEGYSEDSISTFFKNYKDDYESAMEQLREENSELVKRKIKDAEAKKKIENETEFDAYGIPYDYDLNKKREEYRVYDKNGKLKGEDDTDYEKMLENAPDKQDDENTKLDELYPEMAKEEERKKSGVEYPSMESMPEERDDTGISSTEDEKKFLEDSYPEMKDIPDRQ